MTDPWVGRELAGHRVVGVIGRGGMSVVYLAEHIGLHRKVALKVLGPELADDAAFRERFIRESQITARLDHPNVVTVYDAGEAEGVLYISMRYVEGTDLERFLRAEMRLEPDRAVSLVSQAAAALDAAHAAGLVHRDVKPGNILLASDARSSTGKAILSDFGVTKRLETGAGITRTGQFVGTVDYVSPEQIRGEDVDGRADVYSLGCVLYRCLTGEVPFPRETEVATIYAHLQDPSPVPSEHFPELGVGFDASIARALAKSRDDRFDTCRDLADAAGAIVHPPRHATVQPDAVPSHVSPQTKTSRRRLAFVSGGLGVVVGVAIIAFLLFPRSDDGAGPSHSASPSPSPLPHLAWKAPSAGLLAPGDQEIADAAVVDGTIVAVGHDDAGGDRNAAVWTSSDGRRWTHVSGTSLGTTGEQRMDAVATVGGDVVTVGSERIGGDLDPAVWRSADRGTSWDRVEGAASGLHEAGDQAMHVVVAAAPRVVAAGFDTSPGGDLDAAVWTSKDGSSWTRLTQAAFTGPGDQQILGATTADDRLIVVGSTASGGDLDAAVWVRAAGEWSSVVDGSLGGPGDQQIDAVVANDTGLTAVGWNGLRGNVDAAVWTSADGSSWDRVATSDVFGGAGDQRMVSVTSVGGTLFAGGSSTRDGRDPDGTIWLSADGIAWKRAPVRVMSGAGGQQVGSLISFAANRLLAVGSQDQAGDEQAAAWVAKLTRTSP